MPTLAPTTAVISSPVGDLLVTGDGERITSLRVTDPAVPTEPLHERHPFHALATQLEEYFAGERTEFDVELDLSEAGTPFEQRVWQALTEIPYGETITYAELARRIGSPNACRAVGRANGRNPVWLIVPCHRVIGSDGSLTGYAGGVDLKRRLLELERSLAE
jgi:methylated-DNA-[protein]-cysteine S-methyltransferase